MAFGITFDRSLWCLIAIWKAGVTMSVVPVIFLKFIYLTWLSYLFFSEQTLFLLLFWWLQRDLGFICLNAKYFVMRILYNEDRM